jgi:hypothetical protein
MRVQPVKFRATYSDYHAYDCVQDGFKHFRNEKESVLVEKGHWERKSR